jgi:hypothetical protein
VVHDVPRGDGAMSQLAFQLRVRPREAHRSLGFVGFGLERPVATSWLSAMRDDHFGFGYTWKDLPPIKGLVAFVLLFQLLGLGLGALFPRFPSTFDSAWFGGAIATFPAFAAGLILQLKLNRANIIENKRMVWHLGLVAAALFAFALAMPLLGYNE